MDREFNVPYESHTARDVYPINLGVSCILESARSMGGHKPMLRDYVTLPPYDSQLCRYLSPQTDTW